MSKSILVKDTPESCNKCDSCIIGSVVFWGINGKKIEQEIMNESKRSEKCPLHDMPEKYEIVSMNFERGYNACIDDILAKSE